MVPIMRIIVERSTTVACIAIADTLYVSLKSNLSHKAELKACRKN